jgi:hypothetical protein
MVLTVYHVWMWIRRQTLCRLGGRWHLWRWQYGDLVGRFRWCEACHVDQFGTYGIPVAPKVTARTRARRRGSRGSGRVPRVPVADPATRDVCPASGKVKRSLDYAVQSLMSKWRSGAPVRGIYPCSACGWWHLTSRPPGRGGQSPGQLEWREANLELEHFEVLYIVAGIRPASTAPLRPRVYLARLFAFGLVELDKRLWLNRATITPLGRSLLTRDTRIDSEIQLP